MKQSYQQWLSLLDRLGEIQPSFEQLLDVSDSERLCDDKIDIEVDSTELSTELTDLSDECVFWQ